MIVVDASVVVDFLLGRPPAYAAVGESITQRESAPFHAPELIETETLSALRRLVARGSVTEHRASRAVHHLGELRIRRYSHAPLRQRVWDLRDRLSAYDASYLALAQALEDSALLTADRGLATAGRELLGPERVRLVR